MYEVIIPHTRSASCFFGKETEWCTARLNHDWFSDYNKLGKLYIVIINGKAEYQFHIETDQMRNKEDKIVNLEMIKENHPIIYSIIMSLKPKKES